MSIGIREFQLVGSHGSVVVVVGVGELRADLRIAQNEKGNADEEEPPRHSIKQAIIARKDGVFLTQPSLMRLHPHGYHVIG